MSRHTTKSSLADPVRLMVITTVPETMAAFFSRQIALLAEEGFQIHAVCSRGGLLDSLSRVAGVYTHGVPMQRSPHPARDCVSLIRLINLMRRVQPDVVHAHTPKAGFLGMLAAKSVGIRVRLYTLHGLPLLTRRGKLRRVLEMAEQTSCALATKVYSVSPSLQRVAAEIRLCPAEKLSTLGDGSCAGIDLNRFDPGADWTERSLAVRRAYGIPNDARVVSFVGRIARDKGIAILAAGWPELARQFPDLHLLLAGANDSSDPVPAAVLKNLRAQPRVHFTDGTVVDIAAVYAATEICVLPTFREGLSQVALEAGAMGIPIVSTRIPGIVNSVEDGVTGLLVAPLETEPFVAAVRRLVEDPALRTSLGNAARERVRVRFSEQRVNQLWISEYRKLVGEFLPGFLDHTRGIANSR